MLQIFILSALLFGDAAVLSEGQQMLKEMPNETMASDIDVKAYDSLTISIDEKVKIGKILMTMAENNVVKLLFERKRLESWGHDIQHVHPIRFLGTVFINPRLVYCMRRIRSSGFKWNGFIDGFTERFREEVRNNNINAFLPGFAQSVGVDETQVQTYVNRKDFEGLVLYLMKEKS